MKKALKIIILLLVSTTIKAQEWQAGVRSGIMIASPPKPIPFLAQSVDRSLEQTIYARKEKKRLALDYSISYYHMVTTYSQYVFVFDAPSYYFTQTDASNHIALQFSIQYNLLPFLVRKDDIIKGTTCYVVLIASGENSFINSTETNIIEEAGRPMRTRNHKYYDLSLNIGALFYVSHTINKKWVINGSSTFSVNGGSRLGYYFFNDGVTRRFTHKLGIGYKL